MLAAGGRWTFTVKANTSTAAAACTAPYATAAKADFPAGAGFQDEDLADNTASSAPFNLGCTIAQPPTPQPVPALGLGALAQRRRPRSGQ